MRLEYFIPLGVLILNFACTPLQAEVEQPQSLDSHDQSSLSAGLDRLRHSFRPVNPSEGHWVAENPRNGLSVTIGPDGVDLDVSSDVGGKIVHSSITWRTRSVGYGELPNAVTSGTVSANCDSSRLEIHRPDLVEWFVNSSAGLEQGFTLVKRPRGSDGRMPLCVSLALEGDFVSKVASDGQNVVLYEKNEKLTLQYGKLKAWDATGRILESRMVGGGASVGIEVEDSEAVYPLTIDPVFSQQAYLKASNTGDTSGFFGFKVAIDGNTAVVGAFGENSNATSVNGNQFNSSASQSGAAYVFIFDGNRWTQQAYLKAFNAEVHDNFGFSVSISGSTIVVGAPGERGSSTGVNGPNNNSAADSGAAYVFVRNGSSWSQQAYVKPLNTGYGDTFGRSVTIDGDTIVVGSPREDGSTTIINGSNNDSATDAGAAYVFTRSGSIWTQQAYLKASNAESDDNFGFSVAVAGDSAIVGALLEDGTATSVNGSTGNGASNSGGAYVFTRVGTNWTQQAYLKPSNTGADDEFGFDVAISGDSAVVGAPAEDSISSQINGDDFDNTAESTGAAYVFFREGSSWGQQSYLKASNSERHDRFGQSVAISGRVVVVGAYQEDSNTRGINGDQSNNSAFASGAAYVFSRSQTTWIQRAYLKAHNTDTGIGSWDWFGNSVAIDGDLTIIGATAEHSNARGVNADGFNNSIESAGAAYVFLVEIPPPAPLLSVYGNGNMIFDGTQTTNPENHTDFGTPDEAGGLVLRTFSITNEGDLALSFSGDVTVTGSPAFQIFSMPDSAISPGDSAPLVIGFTPESAGLHQAIVSVVTDDSTRNPFNFAIRGSGAGALIAVRNGSRTLSSSSSSIDFRSVRLRKRSKPIPVTIANIGTVPLTGVNVKISGRARNDFRTLGTPASSIAAGNASTFQVALTPSKRSTLAAQLEIRSSAANGSFFRVLLKGRGK